MIWGVQRFDISEFIPCASCGKMGCRNEGCVCWNCASNRRDRLRSTTIKRAQDGKEVEVWYCSQDCLNQLKLARK